MFIKNKLLKNSSIYILLAFIQKSVSFLLVPIYTKFLNPAEFGIVNQTIALSSIYILILTYALDEAVARFYFQHRNDKKVSEIILGTIVMVSSAIILIGGSLLLIFNNLSFQKIIPGIPKNFIYLGILIIVTSPINTIYQKLLRIKEEAKNYSILMLGYSFIQITLSILFLICYKLNSLGYILALSLTSVLLGIYSFIKLKREFRFIYSKSVIIEALKYSTSIVPHTISSWGIAGYTILALGKILNSTAVGIFNAINFMSVIINVLSKSILDAYQPWVYKKLESENEDIKIIVKAARTLAYCFILLGFFISLFSVEIIKLFINNQYHSGIYIAPILVFSSIVLAIGSIMVFVLYFKKESTKYIGYSTMAGAFINIILCTILIPSHGILGAAISLAISNLTISISKQAFASKALNINVSFIEIYLLAILNLLVAYYVIYFKINLFIKLIIFSIEPFILYLLNKKEIYSLYKLMLRSESK